MTRYLGPGVLSGIIVHNYFLCIYEMDHDHLPTAFIEYKVLCLI